ncbi:Membrane-fusion protein [Burkholderia pseudomallei]|nr:Membrane-fusion protein [Burkholderia pseudomallei]
MKSFVYAAVAASILATPLASFAQADQQPPLTREQVRSELVQLEQNGYKPEAGETQYPANVQAALQRMLPAQQTLTHADTSGYGVQPAGAAESGGRASRSPTSPAFGHSIYFGN